MEPHLKEHTLNTLLCAHNAPSKMRVASGGNSAAHRKRDTHTHTVEEFDERKILAQEMMNGMVDKSTGKSIDRPLQMTHLSIPGGTMKRS
jgi:hypothetical protein